MPESEPKPIGFVPKWLQDGACIEEEFQVGPAVDDDDSPEFGTQGEYVYLIGPVEGCYKIGVSKNPERRVGQISLMLPVDLSVIHFIQSFRTGWLEKYLHAAFRHRRVRGEWFRLTTEDQAMICGIPAVDSVDDLPIAVVALYTQNKTMLQVSVNPATKRGFHGLVISDGHDMAGVIQSFMEWYAATPEEKRPAALSRLIEEYYESK